MVQLDFWFANKGSSLHAGESIVWKLAQFAPRGRPYAKGNPSSHPVESLQV